MREYGLKDAIDEYMPLIDEPLQELKLPIFERFMRAARIFVEMAITESKFSSKEELLKSEVFNEKIVPLVNDWYWAKYGELARKPKNRLFSGIITPYGQPVLISFPSTNSKVEIPNKTSWLIFPDCVQETESLSDMLQSPLELDKMPTNDRKKLLDEFKEIVSMTRSINLNIMSASSCFDVDTNNMANGIWSHFEKAINDILSFKNHQASIGCWELHLAIEKSLKVYLKQKDGKKHVGHDLGVLCNKVEKNLPNIDFSLIETLPSDKKAIQFRYSELITDIESAVSYYQKALMLVFLITNELSFKYRFHNTSFLIKVAPWAK